MTSRWLIGLLLALNLVLAGYIISQESKPAQPNGRRFQTSPPAPRVAAAVAPGEAETPETDEFHWAQLEAEDYREYIQRLRSIGCPEQTIHDIIIADLEKLMSARVREIEGEREPAKYWKAEARELIRTLDSLEKVNLKEDVDFEKREIIRELLGIDLAARRLDQKGEIDIYEERLEFLDEGKRAQVRMLVEKANREELYLREKSWMENDELTPEERQQLRHIQRTRDEAIGMLLIPAEKEQFDLWFSPAANQVRNSFVGLDTTEEEFLGVYNIQREFDQHWGTVEPTLLEADEKRAYEQAEAEQQAKIKEFLGDDRFREYQRARDDDYRALTKAAIQYNLPITVANEVYRYKQIATEERAALLTNPAFTAAERAAILSAISEEAERAVVEKLGPQAFRNYIRRGAGNWIWE